MARTLVIGSCTFLFPEDGTKAGWGEVVTDWACAVTTVIGTLSAPDDISLTCAAICNSKATATPVGTGASALKFSTASVRSFEANYFVYRTNACCVVSTETGTMTGVYNGSTWLFQHDHVGCAGMDFDIASCGQVRYYSNATGGTGIIKYTASTKAQA